MHVTLGRLSYFEGSRFALFNGLSVDYLFEAPYKLQINGGQKYNQKDKLTKDGDFFTRASLTRYGHRYTSVLDMILPCPFDFGY